MSYNLLSKTPPQMPKKLPSSIRQTISKVPGYMKPAAANALFPQFAANMRNCEFLYSDNVWHEPSVVGTHLTVAESGVGKGYLDPMLEAICRYQREHDEESRRKLIEWARITNTKGQNKDKPERPTDCAILVPESDITNAALIQLCMDAEAENNSSISLLLPELDALDQMCGSHKKVTTVLRKNYDTKRHGAQRATAAGISGNPFLRLKINASCVKRKARQFFKGDAMTDGTLGRFGVSHIPRPANTRKMPKQGNYDEAYQRNLDVYLTRLRAASGQITVPRIMKLMERLKEELDDINELSDSEVFQSLTNRSLCLAWGRGCILYVAEGYRWTSEIAEFVEWSLWYDLWSKVQVFACQMQDDGAQDAVDMRKCGPANMLDMLPDSFSRQQMEDLRISLGKSASGMVQLCNWRERGHIAYDEVTRLYSKTEEYKKRSKEVQRSE